MTLLESLIATVLLAVVAIACLEGTRGATRLQQRNAEMVAALAHAESELAAQVAGASTIGAAAEPGSGALRVSRRPYTAAGAPAALDILEVEVALPNGGTTRLSRLVERAR